MFMFLGILLLVDVSVGLQGWRKYLKSQDKEMMFPLDILAEMALAIFLELLYLWSIIKFKDINIKNSSNTLSYEASTHRNNFRMFTSKRAYLINEYENSVTDEQTSRFIASC